MPSKSKAQHNLMAMVANDPKAAKRVDIPQSVGSDYMQADKGRKFPSTKAKINKQDTRHGKLDMPFKSLKKYAGMAEGGDVKKEMKAANIFAKAGEKKLAAHERREAAGKEKDTPAIAKKEMSVLKKAKAPKDVMSYEKSEHASMGMKKGGKVKKFADGDLVAGPQMTPLEMEASRNRGHDAFRASLDNLPPARAAVAPPARVAPARAAARPMNPQAVRATQMMRGLRGGMKKGGGIESKGKTKGKFI